MSGTERLLSYIKRRGESKRDPTIIVDSREATTATKVLRGLEEREVHVRIKPLQKGDYILSDLCAVERKTVQDFVHTLTRRDLFKQLFKLKENYPETLLLLEGYLPSIYKFSRIKPASVWGAMYKIAINGVATVNTSSHEETVDFLCVAAYQEQKVKKRMPSIHPVKDCGTTSDAQLFLMSSLPNIGKERATAILNHYENPLEALTRVDEWKREIEGLGPKITSEAKKVLTTPYKKEDT